jgi:hypothetical protein
VLPAEPVPGIEFGEHLEAPPPDPPVAETAPPTYLSLPPLPPPVDVIVENIEFDPGEDGEDGVPSPVAPVPPAPIVIGTDPLIFNFVPPGNEVL